MYGTNKRKEWRRKQKKNGKKKIGIHLCRTIESRQRIFENSFRCFRHVCIVCGFVLCVFVSVWGLL